MPLTAHQRRRLRATTVAAGQNRVAAALAIAAVTQEAVEEATGLPQSYVSDVKRNRYRTITVENAHKFAVFFGVPIEDLFPSISGAVPS